METRRVLGIAGGALVLLIIPAFSSARSFTSCGERTVAPNQTKILKVRKMSCGNARDIAHKVELGIMQGDLSVGDSFPVRRFRCEILGYFDPLEPAYECVHTHKRGERLKVLYPPEREGSEKRLAGTRSCGDFDVAPQTGNVVLDVQVRGLTCRAAKDLLLRMDLLDEGFAVKVIKQSVPAACGGPRYQARKKRKLIRYTASAC